MRYFKALFFAAPLFLISCQSVNVSPFSSVSAGTQSHGVSPHIVQGGSGSQWITIEPFNCCVDGLVDGPKSTVWFVGEPVFDRRTTSKSEPAASSSSLSWRANGRSGSIDQSPPNQIGRIDMAHNVTTFTLPIDPTAGSIDSITAGPDGNMWVIIPRNDSQQAIVKVTPSGTMTTYQAPCATGTFAGIAAGADGNLWFGVGADMIGRITPSGQSTCFPTTGLTFTVAAGPDGNVWFTEAGAAGQFLGKITPSGTLTEYPEPNECGLGFGLVTAGDGNLYSSCSDGLARISPANGKETIISSVAIQKNLAVSGTGENAKLYYAVYPNHLRIRHLKTGTVDDDDLPSGPSQAALVAFGPDGNLWYYSFGGELGVDVFRIITIDPLSMTLSVGQSQTATASETKAPSALSAKSMNRSIATVVNGSSPGEFKVTGQGVGTTTIRIGDTKHNSADISVTVQ